MEKLLLILDGGLGTTLETHHNVKFSAKTTPTWSSHLLLSESGRQVLRDVHAAWVSAGCDVLETATYQGWVGGFMGTTMDAGVGGEGENELKEKITKDQAEGYLRGAVHLAREAFVNAGKGSEGVVALSLGAYGATLVPTAEFSGDYRGARYEEIRRFHQERIDVFAGDERTWREVDVVAFETLPRREEVRAVREVMEGLEERGRGKRWWVSCVWPGEEEGVLPDGSCVEDVVREMVGGDGGGGGKEAGLWGVGINCTKIGKLEGLIGGYERAVEKLGVEGLRLVVYPDGAGGLVYDEKTQEWVAKEDGEKGVRDQRFWDERMSEIVKATQKRGKWNGVVVGGCCKTLPDDIAKLKQRFDR